MTTIVAVKKGKRVCLAADSLTTLGRRKEILDKHLNKKSKIFQIGPNYIGSSGHASWSLILSHYFSKKKVPEWKNEKEIFRTFTLFHQQLKNKYHFYSSLHLPFESSKFSFLIINRHGIFEIEDTREVHFHSQFSAIGSGEKYALGAIRSIYHRIEDPHTIARIGVEVAAYFDQNTDLPTHAHCIDLD